jgi:pimeloyl-ACP methyl ester carboxylesterase
MREFPLFVPFEGDHLAAVLTVPEAETTGLVLLMTGIGAPRSHRFQMWTKAARALAERGLASVRMDYRGMGDSTGSLQAWDRNDPPVDQARAVAELGLRALGVDRVAAIGNCGGSWTALALAAAMPQCVAATLILMPVIEPSLLRRRLNRLRDLGPVAYARRRPALRRALARPVDRLSRRTSPGVRGPFPRALDHGRLLLLYGQDEEGYGPRVKAHLDRMLARCTPEQRSRYELRVLPFGHLSGFDSLATQEGVIETTVEWLARAFQTPVGGAGGQRGRPEPARAAPEPE